MNQEEFINSGETLQTELLGTTPAEIQKAGALLASGKLVAIPTETVYGLAANAFDEAAVRSIYTAKGRPSDNPLIVHISSFEQVYELARKVPPEAIKLAEKFWPGPLTIVLPKKSVVPDAVTGGLDTVALRMPSHPVAREIIEAAKVPLAAPSANLSGKPSPTKAQHVFEDLKGRIPAIINGGECGFGVESTVVSLCGEAPRLLRPGAVTPEEIALVCGKCEVDPAVLKELEQGQIAASPGMKYQHYSPEAKIVIVDCDLEQYIKFCEKHKSDGVFALCFEGEGEKLSLPFVEYGKENDPASQAQELFSALRRLDELGAKVAYARCCSAAGVGLAVRNRLLRAAGFNVISAEEAP